MNTIFDDLSYLVSYLDDHLVSSTSEMSYLAELRTFFERLAANGLTINPAKCVFMHLEVEFLGHRLSASGLAPLQGHVIAVQEFPRHHDLKGLQRFLGMVNFYRRFLPCIARTLARLMDATRGKLVNSDSWHTSPSLPLTLSIFLEHTVWWRALSRIPDDPPLLAAASTSSPVVS